MTDDSARVARSRSFTRVLFSTARNALQNASDEAWHVHAITQDARDLEIATRIDWVIEQCDDVYGKDSK